MDAGPVLAQAEVPVLPGDTVETLHERIKECERQLYPETIRAVMARIESEKVPAKASPAEGGR
jgi:phosphoribosylglycinamide formyltransferase-1